MKKAFPATITLVLAAVALPVHHAAAGNPFPDQVATQPGSPPEGFTIGKGHTAYQGSVDGSIYKADLRSGEGELLVDVIEEWTVDTCRLLGMRIDPRTNYLFGTGCFWGNVFVYDADNGALVSEYQLAPPFQSVLNDLAITKDAVYFTDFAGPFLYRLPLARNGGLPASDAGTAIPLTGEFGDGVCNGIVATPDGETLIIGDSFRALLFRVDPDTGDAKEISIDPPLDGFLDGIVMAGRTLYILVPAFVLESDRILVVELDKDLLSGTIVDTITDPDLLDGVASGAIFGNSLYFNNAKYFEFPTPTTEYVLSKVPIRPGK